MKRKFSSTFGFINSRNLTALLLCAVGGMLAMFSFASTPSSGTLSPGTPLLTYDAGPFNVANQSPLGLGQLDTGPRCDAADPCDSYTLTATLPAGYAAAHPNGAIKITMYWTDTGSGQSNYDLYIYNGTNPTVDGNHPADHQSASNANPEVAVINPLIDGTTQYTLEIVPNTPTQETVHVRIELLQGSGGLNANFGGADPTTPGVPRYQIFFPPAGSTAQPSRGEFNIGFNPHTKRIMTMNSGPIWRLTPPEILAPAQPECCEALWENRSAITTNTPADLDPILWTDQTSGRTFASNSTAGANASYAYSDSDGEPSMTQPTGWTEGGFSPPNGGADHETIGSGPYPLVNGLPNPLATAANQGEAVYYCSQDIVGPASCQRSDTLGVSYGPGVFAYTGNGVTSCGGLHGHLHVAPDGTAWLPVNQCGGAQGGALSTTSGATWQQFIVTGSLSQQQGADPSIGIDTDSTVYYAYVNNEPVPAGNPPEGHAHVKVSHDHGVTWINDFDLGASHGIKNAAEIEAVGGSSGRAGVGFLGTDVNGDYQANSFPGKWYAFIATTYDGGVTWTTVNATPNDPVQSKTGIWQQGGGATDRNLLDFNEITIDDKGRVLYGFSDGCVTPDCIGGGAPNDFVAHMRVARQSGGKTLFASYDANTDTTTAKVAKPACLSGTRDPSASHLTWKVPDNGGIGITSYEIWRGTAPGNETKLFTTLNPDPNYADINPPSNQHLYYYVKAINSVGVGTQSNEIDLVIVPPPPPTSVCLTPGLTKLTDPAGDTSVALGFVNTPAPPGSDLRSFQLAQPYQADGIPRLIFTINTWDNGQSPQPAGSAWYVAMKIPGPDPSVPGDTSTVHYRGVHMIWNSTTPTFESYVPGANGAGGVDGRFIASVIGPAEPGSSYASPFNKVVIIVKASDLGLAPGDTISGFLSGVSQSDPTQSTITALYDYMPNSLSFADSYVLAKTNTCSPLLGWVSRKTHGSAGDFDINLPSSGTSAIECRGSGASNNYTIIYALDKNIALPGTASLAQGSATISSVTVGPNANQVTINLTNVTTAQHLFINLNGMQDVGGTTYFNLFTKMDVLVGDVNASGLVDSGDVFLVRQQTGQNPGPSNFREDVNASGLIDSGDVFITRQQTGIGLSSGPSAPPWPPAANTKSKIRNREPSNF
jgi:hypothetical protein